MSIEVGKKAVCEFGSVSTIDHRTTTVEIIGIKDNAQGKPLYLVKDGERETIGVAMVYSDNSLHCDIATRFGNRNGKTVSPEVAAKRLGF